MTDIKLPFGLMDGAVVHISQVKQGLACGCVCPDCGESLVAHKGSSVTHHFAHLKGAECARAVETALHLAAKRILTDRRKITLPAVHIHFDSHRSPLLLAPEQTFALDDVHEERRTGDIFPDILAVSGTTPLMIEIRVTHAVDEAKLQKIRARGISTIELDLSAAARTFSPDDLADTVINRTDGKTWLFNAKAEKLKRLFLQSGVRKNSIRRGLALHVDDCPIEARIWKGKPYANVIDDCVNCQFALGVGPTMDCIVCGGRHKLKTFHDLRAFYKQRDA
jgi:hypothetical protein